jgi:hypothetical protein
MYGRAFQKGNSGDFLVPGFIFDFILILKEKGGQNYEKNNGCTFDTCTCRIRHSRACGGK